MRKTFTSCPDNFGKLTPDFCVNKAGHTTCPFVSVACHAKPVEASTCSTGTTANTCTELTQQKNYYYNDLANAGLLIPTLRESFSFSPAATGINLRLFTALLPNHAYRIKVKDNNQCISK
jgi:hypothetical protein